MSMQGQIMATLFWHCHGCNVQGPLLGSVLFTLMNFMKQFMRHARFLLLTDTSYRYNKLHRAMIRVTFLRFSKVVLYYASS